MIKIRLHGTLIEIQRMAASMKNFYSVVDISKPYKDRGESELYRIYITVNAGVTIPGINDNIHPY